MGTAEKNIAAHGVSLEEAPADRPYLLVFNSIHRVLKSEKLLQAEGMSFKLMPTPRPVVSDCGLSIMIGGGLLRPALGLLASNRIKVVQLYAVTDTEFVPVGMG
jgi:hypothetical protein